MSIKEFQVLQKLGEGAYSSVYRVKRLIDSSEYALKRVKLGNLSDKEKQNALNQVRILASVRHPNIIGYKEAFLDEASNSLCIVMEFADNGDLYQKITDHQKRNQMFSEQQIWTVFIQVVKGLKALHDLKILHRDLKSANVFLTTENLAKLGDMNVSKVAKRGLCETQTGTPYYASPEVWKDQAYDSKSDIWSLGCVLYEMITLNPPFRAEDMEGLYKKVIRGSYSRIPTQYSQDLSQVIKALLQTDPSNRPSCDKILTMPVVLRHLNDKTLIEPDEGVPQLLKTIRVPKNIHNLTDKLPKPNYIPVKYRRSTAGNISSLATSLDARQENLNSSKQQSNQGVDAGSLPSLKKQRINKEDIIDRLLRKQKKREESPKRRMVDASRGPQLEISGRHYDGKLKADELVLPKIHQGYNNYDNNKIRQIRDVYRGNHHIRAKKIKE